MRQIDINCDMGELPEAIADGSQDALMPHLTSANIACGGHAGDEAMMRTTIQQAVRAKVAVGAHPGYADRANFGRLELTLTPAEIATSVFEQLRTFGDIAAALGAPVVHVKAHGALYNQAARDRQIAAAIADGVARWNPRKDVVMVGLAGSGMLGVFRDAGFPVAAEAFADRGYEKDGSLRARSLPGSLLEDPGAAGRQALGIVQRGRIVAVDGTSLTVQAETLCVHGDTPGASAIAAQVAKTLRDAGITLAPLRRRTSAAG